MGFWKLPQHVMKTEHMIDWNSAIFLGSDCHLRRRKIKEALFINSLNPQKQMWNIVMNLEKRLEISACWKSSTLKPGIY